MKYAIIENGVVVNLAKSDAPLGGNWVVAEGMVNTGDLWDGEVFTPAPVPAKAPEALQAEIVAATQNRLDDFARTRNYDGILSACTYATSSVPKFAAEGQYAVNARDNTWATLYALMDDVMAGQWQMPESFDDVEPLLPTLTWPL